MMAKLKSNVVVILFIDAVWMIQHVTGDSHTCNGYCTSWTTINCRDDETCNVSCDVENDRRRRNLLDALNAGGCNDVTINCPTNAACNIDCNYRCDDLVVYGQDSSSVSITNCDNCDRMTIHCPNNGRNGMDDQCKVEIEANIYDLTVYTQESFYDFQLTRYSNNLLGTPTIYCGETNTEYQCQMKSDGTDCISSSNSLCKGGYRLPTSHPTLYPTTVPTSNPTDSPSSTPTNTPSLNPTLQPSLNPTTIPSDNPTANPITATPTSIPTSVPTMLPSEEPSTQPTSDPTNHPTNDPTSDPTNNPTFVPTSTPSLYPTIEPTMEPTVNPTVYPTLNPSKSPSSFPTSRPTPDRIVIPVIEESEEESLDESSETSTTGYTYEISQGDGEPNTFSNGSFNEELMLLVVLVSIAVFIALGSGCCCCCIFYYFKRKNLMIRELSMKESATMARIASISAEVDEAVFSNSEMHAIAPIPPISPSSKIDGNHKLTVISQSPHTESTDTNIKTNEENAPGHNEPADTQETNEIDTDDTDDSDSDDSDSDSDSDSSSDDDDEDNNEETEEEESDGTDDITTIEQNDEGNLQEMNDTESSRYLYQQQLHNQQLHNQQFHHQQRIGKYAIPPSLKMVYPLPHQQRMPHVVIDEASKGSLGTIASLPSSHRKYPF